MAIYLSVILGLDPRTHCQGAIGSAHVRRIPAKFLLFSFH